MNIKKGILAPDFQTVDVLGNPLRLKDYQGKKVYIAFLKNVNCAMCSLHLFNILRIIDRLKAKEMEVIVFYESAKDIFKHSYFFREQILKENKMKIISDPNRKFYTLYGAELSAKKASFENFKATPGRMEELQEAMKLGFTGNGVEPGTNPDAIPADFLLDEKLIVRSAHYGNDPGDHTSIAVIESFAINRDSI